MSPGEIKNCSLPDGEVSGYSLIDTGGGRKLENIGGVILDRPAVMALWSVGSPSLWSRVDAKFDRKDGGGWVTSGSLPKEWFVKICGITLKLSTTEFGHLGIFPEHALLWPWISERAKGLSVLNLFAYSGGATLALLGAGAKVCHVDASRSMVDWARKNALLNNLQDAPIRWIVEDVRKFLRREIRRNVKYDGIILDPPSFGRGSKGELFKIEEDLIPMLDECQQLLTAKASFFVMTCHTPGFTPRILKTIVEQRFSKFGWSFQAYELVIPATRGISLPGGIVVKKD